MNRFSRPSRTPSKLSESLHHQINAYCLAASAAGVGLMALAQPATARVVHGRIDFALCGNESYPFNPAGQRITPLFRFWGGFSYTSVNSFSWVRAGFSGEVSGASALLASNGFVASLKRGAPVGPGSPFGQGNVYGLLFTYSRAQGSQNHQGNFKFNQIGYFGFRFPISGKKHYGWVRIHIHLRHGLCSAVEHLLDYGYETIPNKPIIAGKTHGKDDMTVQPASLGALAAGSSALSTRRRDEGASK
jgi:hypothetical protein